MVPQRALEVALETVTLWRPVGPKELDLLKLAGMKVFPPRLPDQPIFYPVTTAEYARTLATAWNRKRDGGGWVTKFDVRKDYLDGFEPQVAGGRACMEYWIPAEEIGAFNAAIVGFIEVVESYPAD
jgi:hypothetical protein